MFERVGTGNENVIDVNENKIEATCYFIHKTLEGLGGVTQSKRHFGELEKTKWCGEGSFTNVFSSHGNLVVGTDKINFGKDGGAMKLGGEIV